MRAAIGAAVMAALAASKKQETHVATITTYLPFEQHRCANFYVLGHGQAAPTEACEAGGHGPGAVLVDDTACHGGCHGGESMAGITSDKVKVISSTVTTNAVITTSSDVITTLTTTNAEGEPTTEVVTTETPVMVTTPVTTVVEITTTEPVTTDEVVTTTITVVQDPVDDDDSRIPPEPGPGRDPEPEDPTCPRPTCKLGVEMALYDNPFVNDFTSTYESFSPLYFKTAPPIETSVTRDPIFISDDDTGSGFDPTLRNAAAGYRGFMFACQDGTYTFESTYSDDITIMWFGEKAYAGYTRENADIIQFYYGDNELKTVTREIKAGTYYPIRVLWGNTNGASDLSLHIYAPDGRELSGVDEGHEDYLTTQACDGSYPPYAPWGAEP